MPRVFPGNRFRWFSAAFMAAILLLPSVLLAGPIDDEVERLIVKLKSTASEDRESACSEIEYIGPEARAALPILVKLLENEDDASGAALAIVSMRGEAIPAIRRALKSSGLEARRELLDAIEEMHDDAAPLIPDLLLLLDEDKELRQETMETLCELSLRPDLTVPVLSKAIFDKDRNFAMLVAYALGDLGPSAVEPLKKAAASHLNPDVRGYALMALVTADSSGKTAVAALAKGLRDKSRVPSQYSQSVRAAAASELADMAPHAAPAKAALIEVLKDKETRDNQFLYQNVTYTLATIGAKEAIGILKQDMKRPLKKHSNDWLLTPSHLHHATCLRVYAATALARIDPDSKDAIDVLKGVLQDGQWKGVALVSANGSYVCDPRAEAAIGLGLLGGRAKSALPALREAMKWTKAGDSPDVKAAWAVARIDSSDRDCVKLFVRAGWMAIGHETPQEVVEILGKRIKPMIPYFVEQATDDEGPYYLELLERVDPLAIDRVVKGVFKWIRNDSPWDHWDGDQILASIGPHGEPAIPQIVGYLNSKDQFQRAAAARMLGKMHKQPDKSVPALVKALRDPRPLVRTRAAVALGRFGSAGKPALKSLQAATKDSYYMVRTAASKAAAAIEKAKAG